MRKAFTLVEMLVAVTLLAIMASMVVPMISAGNDTIRIPTVAQMSLTDLLYIQNSAITKQKTMWVYIISNGSATGYTVAYSDTQAKPASAPQWAHAAGQSNYTAGKILTQPASGSAFFVRFGPGAPSPYDRAALRSPAKGYVFGFNHIGAPVDENGEPMLSDIAFTITSITDVVEDQVKTTLRVSPLTGDITAE